MAGPGTVVVGVPMIAIFDNDNCDGPTAAPTFAISSSTVMRPLPLGLPLIKQPYGRITAIAMNSGEHRWMVPNGDTPDDIKNNAALRDVKLPPAGKPSKALLLVTKMLLFAAEGYGGAPILRAYDKATGSVVSELPLPGARLASP